MDNNIQLNAEFFQARKYKSFIKVGQTFIDIKQTIGFSFLDNPEGYIIVQFVYDSGRALNATLRNREEFFQFLLELDPFIDDKTAMQSMKDLIDDIEKTYNKTANNNLSEKEINKKQK